MGELTFSNDYWKYRPRNSFNLVLDTTSNSIRTENCYCSLNPTYEPSDCPLPAPIVRFTSSDGSFDERVRNIQTISGAPPSSNPWPSEGLTGNEANAGMSQTSGLIGLNDVYNGPSCHRTASITSSANVDSGAGQYPRYFNVNRQIRFVATWTGSTYTFEISDNWTIYYGLDGSTYPFRFLDLRTGGGVLIPGGCFYSGSAFSPTCNSFTANDVGTFNTPTLIWENAP